MLKFLETKKGNIYLIIISSILLITCFLTKNSSRYLEMYATVFGLIQATLIMFNKKENWIFYNYYTIAFLILSLIYKLYGDVIENIIYIILGIIGTFSWYKVIKKQNNKLTIKFLTYKERIIWSLIMIFISIIIYLYLKTTNDPQSLLDAITTAMGLTATYLMAKKKIDSWIIWFFDDILMTIVYFKIPEQPISLLILNIIWTILALGTYINWYKLSLKKQKL